MKNFLSVLLASLILLLCSSGEEAEAKKAKNLKPIVETVKKVDIKDVVSITGELQAVNKLELKSEASGRIDTIYVKEGARLRKGDIILRIDPERLLNSKEKLALTLQKAQLTLDMANRDYENAQKLAQFGKIASNELDDLKNRYEVARISLEELKLNMRDIQKELDNTVIRSPMAGVLTGLNVSEGGIVVSATSGNSGGTSIGTIADVTQLEVLTEVGEIDYPKVRMQMPVDVSMASNPMRITAGKVSFISLSARKMNNSTVSNFSIRISLDSLLPEMVPGVNVNVDLVMVEKKNVLGVPYSMVTQEKHGDKMVSTVLVEGDKKTRKIQVGLTDYKYFEVLEGLKEGESVTKKPEGMTKSGGPRGKPH